MNDPLDRATIRALVAQACVGLGNLVVLALAPPARGEMLLLPLANGAPVVRLAREGDALLVGAGPGGGLVVRGDRNALFWRMLRGGVLMVAAPAAQCGKGA